MDRVHVSFYAFVLVVALLRLSALPNPLAVVAWYGGALLATLFLARALARWRGWAATWPRVLFTLGAAPFSFLMLAFIVPFANPFHGERALRAIDDAMFLGRNPNEMLDAIAWPPLTEVLQIVYACYYLIPIVLMIALVLEGRRAAVGRALFLALLCLYGSYVGYFLVPATGPNLNEFGLYPEHFARPMRGVWMAEDIRRSLLEAEWIKHDCWPSGHTALSATCLVLARREGARWGFWVLLAPVVLLIFSTMYLRYHYVIDVVCGLALAWAVLRYGPRFYERWKRGEAPASPAAPPGS